METISELKNELVKEAIELDITNIDHQLCKLQKIINKLDRAKTYMRANEMIEEKNMKDCPLPLKNYEYLE